MTKNADTANRRSSAARAAAARPSDASLGPIIPIALLTAFMLWAVLNPMGI